MAEISPVSVATSHIELFKRLRVRYWMLPRELNRFLKFIIDAYLLKLVRAFTGELASSPVQEILSLLLLRRGPHSLRQVASIIFGISARQSSGSVAWLHTFSLLVGNPRFIMSLHGDDPTWHLIDIRAGSLRGRGVKMKSSFGGLCVKQHVGVTRRGILAAAEVALVLMLRRWLKLPLQLS